MGPTDRLPVPSTWNDVAKEGVKGVLEFGREAAFLEDVPPRPPDWV